MWPDNKLFDMFQYPYSINTQNTWLLTGSVSPRCHFMSRTFFMLARTVQEIPFCLKASQYLDPSLSGNLSALFHALRAWELVHPGFITFCMPFVRAPDITRNHFFFGTLQVFLPWCSASSISFKFWIFGNILLCITLLASPSNQNLNEKHNNITTCTLICAHCEYRKSHRTRQMGVSLNA